MRTARIAPLALLAAAFALNAMPPERENELVHKYCASCHTDAASSGGLSLQHFDANTAAPSLAAMMLSKLRGGAMGASGLPHPDKATTDQLFQALESQSAGSHNWQIETAQNSATASILRELPALRDANQPALYRLILTCNAATNQGNMQLAWAPAPKTGTLSATVDNQSPRVLNVEGPLQASLLLPLTLPSRKLRIQNLFPNESVDFSFDDLPAAARQSLAACFP